MQAVLVVSRFL